MATVSLLLVVAFVSCFSPALCSSGVIDNFSIKPDNQRHTTEVKLDDGTLCSFTYEASGGTNEEWQIFVAKVSRESPEKVYTCQVLRANEKASYLYFKYFSAEIQHLEIVTTDVFDSSGSALLKDEEYIVDKGVVSSKADGFSNSLSKLRLSSK